MCQKKSCVVVAYSFVGRECCGCVDDAANHLSLQQKKAPNTKKKAKKRKTKAKNSGSTCDAQTETCKKKKKKEKKKSLAELPAELKHITQRCKKKVTTIAKVTASELAIFKKHMTKNVIFPLSPAWKTKDVWFKKIAKKAKENES